MNIELLGWSHDGVSLYWQEGRNVVRQNPDGSGRELLFTLPELPENERWLGGQFRTYGAPCRPRRGVDPLEFVCAIDESVTELFLVDLSAGGA